MRNNTPSQTLTNSRFLAFEKAREATITLSNLKGFLTKSELETLEILLDEKSSGELVESLREKKQGKIEPIENILG